MNMTVNSTFVQKCVCDTAEGLQAGLSHFSGASSVAVIYSLIPNGHLYIYDPYSLLRGHEPKMKQFYLKDHAWAKDVELGDDRLQFSNIKSVNALELDGLISFGGKSVTVPYQMWFTEHHPDLSSTGPTERWLEHAVLRFSHDIANEKELYTGISGNFLREYSTHAIHDHIVRETKNSAKRDMQIQVYPALNTILAISKTREEGMWPHGELVFVDPHCLHEIEFLARFKNSEQPQLDHFKHVRKLLQAVEYSGHKLISDGLKILGISNSTLPGYSITADFQGRVGYLRLNRDPVCSFADGRFQSTTQRAKLFEIEEAFLDNNLESTTRDLLFQIVAALVHDAENKKHGCTLVIDLNDKPLQLAGQNLDEPLDLCNPKLLELACALSKVDGALHIGADHHLHGFACLLDGHAISGEDRARGARYNSALRFATENINSIVVVVSSDHPVSVVQHGIEFRGVSPWRSPVPCTLKPEALQNWLAVAE